MMKEISLIVAGLFIVSVHAQAVPQAKSVKAQAPKPAPATKPVPVVKQNPNAVATFFEKSERQIESQSQCRELKRALVDCMARKPDQLKSIRYQDYKGAPNQWTAPDVFKKYFSSKAPLKPETFYSEYQKPEARRSIRQALAGMPDCGTYTVK
jgi:hypothetical protein